MKLQLKSDFRDYYDYMFDRDGEIFERYSRTDLHRRDAFDLLGQSGYNVPPHGTAKTLKTLAGLAGSTENFLVVAYDDPLAHRGEGKRLVHIDELDPETYCSLYIPQEKSISFRDLWIGKLWIGISYESDDIWRSNVGDVDIKATVPRTDVRRPNLFKQYPIVAVDTIGDERFAVDFNTAPGISDPVKNILNPSVVVDYVKEFWHNRNEPRI